MPKFKIKIKGECILKCQGYKCNKRKVVKFTRTIDTVMMSVVKLMPESDWTIVTSTLEGTYALCPGHSKRRTF